jgi:hypothetical protein
VEKCCCGKVWKSGKSAVEKWKSAVEKTVEKGCGKVCGKCGK